MHVRWLRLLCCAAALLGPSAAGQAGAYVPPELEGWRGWVLHGQEHRRCPFLYDSDATQAESFFCAWPGKLEIEVATQSGTFVQRWTVFGTEQWLPLPGDDRIWPRDVTANGQPISLTSRRGVPTIRLAPGTHRVAGSFAWRKRPARLAVPPGVGLVGLSVDGEQVAMPERNDAGLWLGEGRRDQTQADALQVQAYRRLQDGVPTRLTSIFLLEVSGSVREAVLSPALPDGFTPLALTSELPAQLDPNGDLRLQVRPGQWQLTLTARADTALDAVTLPTPTSNLPQTEIWSFAANPRLRATLAEAPRPVDPALVDSRWPELPTFRITPGDALRVVERSRGRADATNEIHLHRQLWLDFDRRGFTFADQLHGVMRTGWRLDMAPPYALNAAVDTGENLLVTRNAAAASADEDVPQDAASAGVEIRRTHFDVEALGRIEHRGGVSATGWLANLTSMAATLHLPPGTKLLAAFGVDDAPSSWAGRWRLLDFFLVFVITVAVARLFGRVAAAVALVALVLSFHEPGAPAWTWLNLLAAAAVARVAPPGRLQRVARSYRLGSFVLLLILLVPFAIAQIRISLYPQLEPEAHRRGEAIGLFQLLAGGDFPPQAVPRMAKEDSVAAVGSSVREDFARPGELAKAALAPPDEPETFSRYDDNALVQTGPGRPNWTWTTYSLAWSGPVNAERTMRLLILPGLLTSALRLVAIAALGCFAALFAFDILGRSWRWPFVGRAAPAAILAMLAAGLLGSQDAHADTPTPAILNDLQERLLAPPICVPRCAEIVAADIIVAENELAAELHIHALATVAVPVPGSDDGWKPTLIASESSVLATRRDDDSGLRIQLNAGRHVVTLRGPLPNADAVEIAFPAAPRTIAARSEHWFIEGVEDGTLPSGALRLTRQRSDTAAQTPRSWEASRFPAFATVERQLVLGLDWRLRTVVRRVAPSTGAISLSIPLLADEIVVTDERTVADGNLLFVLAPTQNEFAWASSLPRREALTLQAPRGQPWHEVWRFTIGSAWRATFNGVPESEQGDQDVRVAAFHPRPGETLNVTLTRPEAVPGNTLAFDEVHLQTAVGAHQRNTQLTLTYRSSSGGSHRIGLPDAARLGVVVIDGNLEPLELLDSTLNLPILPGDHVVEVAWDEAVAPGLLMTTPAVQLDAPASNITTTVDMPARWLLFATGPSMGPAILYWSELVALIVASLILGRTAPTPLRTHHWLLLGLGFSTFSWFAFGTVAAWLLAHGARQRLRPGWSPIVYNLSQLGFGVLTLAAFAAILTGIPNGLLGNPDMSVRGFQSSGQSLSWFADQTRHSTPSATVWSLPMWSYQVLILAWALWLTFALIRWLPWVWQCFAESGLWKKREKATAASAPASA